MDGFNTESYEDYKKKKEGINYKRSIYSEQFSKELREQTELLEWLMFNKFFHKHLLFVHTLFHFNQMEGLQNPNAGYVLCFNEEQLKRNTESIVNAIKVEKRPVLLIDARNQTFAQLGKKLTGNSCRNSNESNDAIREILLRSDRVMVVAGLSSMKASKDQKISYARWLIKILDDAHFDNIKPRSDLIFVDYACFLQDAWEQIGLYLEILS